MKHIANQKALLAVFALFSLAFYLKTTVGELGLTRFDDAYMVTRYAKHWLDGNGFSWNSIDGPAYGITSPVHLLVITAILGLTGCSDAMALTITSFAAGLLSVLTLVLLGFLVQGASRPTKSWAPLLVAPSLLLVPPFAYHSLTGMETTLSLLSNSLLACSIVIATRNRSVAALLMCLTSGFLSYATRPDNGLYALLLPPLFFVARDRALWRYATRYAMLFVTLVGCSLIVNRLLFGDVLPLPFFAKGNGFYQGYLGVAKWNAMTEMLLFCTAALPCLLVLVSAASKQSLLRLGVIAAVVIATFAYYATVTQIMGWQARYYYPSIAFAILAAFTAQASEATTSPTPSSRHSSTWRLLAGLAVLLPALSPPVRGVAAHLWEKHVLVPPAAVQSVTRYRPSTDRALPALGWWDSIMAMGDLLEDMPQGTSLAASEYGWIGSRFSHLTIVDLVGLHDRTLAHRGFSAAYVLSREPDLIWFPHGDYTFAVAQILDSPVFQSDYEYYPKAYDYGIALRKSSKSYAGMKEAVTRGFSRAYQGLSMSDFVAEPVAPPDTQ